MMRLKPFLQYTLALVIFTMLAGCGNNSPKNTQNAPLDVNTTFPIKDAVDVPRDVVVSITFNNSISLQNSADSISLLLNGQPVSGRVSLSYDSRTLSFTADQPLEPLGLYTARLGKGISDPSGTPIRTYYSWSFTVHDDTWGAPTQLDLNPTLGSVFLYPQVAIDPNGNAIAVWAQADSNTPTDTNGSIWASHYSTSDGHWSEAALLETDNTGTVAFPKIAMDASGNAIAVWRQLDGTRYNIYATRYNAVSAEWSDAIQIDDSDFSNINPEIAMNAKGDTVVIWSQLSSPNYDIWVSRYHSDSQLWDTPELLNTDAIGQASFPQVAIDANGNSIVIWTQRSGSDSYIKASRFNVNTDNWSAPTPLDFRNDGYNISPQIAMNAAGNATAVWDAYNFANANYGIYVTKYDTSTNSWSTSTQLNAIDTSASSPQVAMNDSGNTVIVWTQSDADQIAVQSIWSINYDASSDIWNTPTLLENGNTNAFLGNVTMDSSGNALAVWNQSYGTWISRYNNANSNWGTAEQMEANTDDTQTAINASGQAVIVWRKYGGSYNRDNIYVNLLYY